MKRFLRYILAFLLAVLAAAAGFVAADYIAFQQKILPGYFVERVEVGGLSREEALQRLESLPVDSIVSRPIILSLENHEIKIAPSQVGARAEPQSSVNEAFRLSQQNLLPQLIWQRISHKKTYLPLPLSLDDRKARAFFVELARGIDRPPADASISIEALDKIIIKEEKYGLKLDVEANVTRLKEALRQGKRTSSLVIAYTAPKILSRPLLDHPPASVLGKFITYYGTHDSPNRIHNIRLVAGMLHHKIILPGEIFSLIDAIGEISPVRGFKEAFVIIGASLTPEAGGGTCQIATTLYNAVLLSDLEVLQRSNHAVYFSIYPLGRDAAVYPPHTDLKFKNSTPYPIVLQAFAEKKRLIIKIFGTAQDKKVLFTPLTIIQGQKEIPLSALAEAPFATKLKRKVFQGGKKIKEEEIRSFYRLHGDLHNVKIERPEPR